MKFLNLAVVLGFVCSSAQAAVIVNDRTESKVDIARVTQVIPLSNQDGIRVNVAIQDLGGSTDVSPSQNVFLTLYSKGEMFSVDAAFNIGATFGIKSAKQIGAGQYEVSVVEYRSEYADGDFQDGFQTVTYQIDARQALLKIKAVNCGDDFDCEAAQNFKSEITVIQK